MMNDRCTHIESLLPAFLDRELGVEETALVRAHLESCDACRAALASFEALEASLVLRHAEVPPVERFLPEFAHAHAAAHHSSVLLRALRALTSVPGVSIVLAMWAGMLAFNFRGPISRALSLSTPDNLVGGIDRFADLLVVLTNGNVWLLIGMCTMVALAIAASTGAMTLRYIRR
jgi:predicted anti-sigma-YlaC factor YlaD